MAVFGRRYQPPEEPGEHIRYMEEQFELFARQVERRLGEVEKAFPAAVEETQTGFQEVREELSALAERASAVEERVRELEDGGAGDT